VGKDDHLWGRLSSQTRRGLNEGRLSNYILGGEKEKKERVWRKLFQLVEKRRGSERLKYASIWPRTFYLEKKKAGVDGEGRGGINRGSKTREERLGIHKGKGLCL